MAADIARHHHERDGGGYPDRLSGSDIPLAARLVAIADVYDALRSRRRYKPALSHAATVQLIAESCQANSTRRCSNFPTLAWRFDRIFREMND